MTTDTPRATDDGAGPLTTPGSPARVALQRLEWSGVTAEMADACPACGSSRECGHSADCYLAAALRSNGDPADAHREALHEIERAAAAAIGDCDGNDGLVTAADARRTLLHWMQRIRSTAVGAISSRVRDCPG